MTLIRKDLYEKIRVTATLRARPGQRPAVEHAVVNSYFGVCRGGDRAAIHGYRRRAQHGAHQRSGGGRALSRPWPRTLHSLGRGWSARRRYLTLVGGRLAGLCRALLPRAAWLFQPGPLSSR